MKIKANCKINLGLNIIEKRTDGYHNIETIFFPIPLADELTIEKAIKDNLITTGIAVECEPEKNLVMKVLNLLRNKGYNVPALSITLHKNIPNGAGLGGGSSDAAFTMKYINEMFNLGINDDMQEEFLATLGADCPIFVKNKPVYAEGIGNIFKSIELNLSDWWLTLIKPNISVPTREAYASVTPKHPRINLQDVIRMPIDQWKDHMFNDFEYSVFKYYPEIKMIKEKLYESGATFALMSGSGSTVYALSKKKLEFEIHSTDTFFFECKL